MVPVHPYLIQATGAGVTACALSPSSSSCSVRRSGRYFCAGNADADICVLAFVFCVAAPPVNFQANQAVQSFVAHMTIGAVEGLGGHTVTAWDDFSVTMQWSSNGGTMSAPIVRGESCSTALFNNLTPMLTSAAAVRRCR